MNHWWVNQNQTYKHEVEGGYLWSPKRTSDGRQNRFYDSMTETRPGDVVFSFCDTMIKAVGIVTDQCRSAPKPTQFGSTGENWDNDGWLVPVEFEELARPIRPKDNMGVLGPVLPSKYAPIRASGDGNQGVYLAPVPPAMAAVLRQLLDGQVEEVVRGRSPDVSTKASAEQQHANQGITKNGRMAVSLLEQATPQHIWWAIQALLNSEVEHEFGDSIDYDLITDSGERLAPKAVFGVALARALGRRVGPEHFSGGIDSPCFRLLREAGYVMVPKNSTLPVEVIDEEVFAHSNEWIEGDRVLRSHWRRERGRGLAKAKKADFRAQNNGQLFCERCRLDPIAAYGSEHGEACIEVHHAAVQIAHMATPTTTRLQDLQCLCANCHRFVHRLLANDE